MSKLLHPSLLVPRRAFGLGAAAALAAPAIWRRPAFGEAAAGGRLTVALFKDLRTLNPIMGIFGNEWRTTIKLYNNLTRLTPSGGVEGDLAERWTANDDASSWSFVLRDGVKFHDGSALTAADVVATVEKILDPKTSAP